MVLSSTVDSCLKETDDCGLGKKARMTVEFLQIKMREYERLNIEIAELKRETAHLEEKNVVQ